MTHFLIELALRYPKLAGLMGAFFAIVFGIMGVSSYMEMQKIGDKPQDATLSSIIAYLNTNDRYWVNVQDGSFDCQSIYYHQVGSSVDTEIFLENPDKSIVMLVTYTEKLPCSDIENSAVQGVAYKMSKKHQSLLADAGRLQEFPNQTKFMALCVVCSQGNSKGLVVISLILVPLSLSLYPLVLWGRRQRAKKPKVANTADEIFEN